MLRFVVAFVKSARHVAAKVSEQRRFKFRIGAPQQQGVRPGHRRRMQDGFPEHSFGLARSCGSAKEPVFRGAQVKLFLAIERPIAVAETLYFHKFLNLGKIRLAVDLRESAADNPGSHGSEHAGFHAKSERVPGSQERPDEAAHAGDLQQVFQANRVGQLFEESLVRKRNFGHFFAPCAARRATALSISATTCWGSSSEPAPPLYRMSVS